MTNCIKYALFFSAGAAIGVLASRKYFKTKYERIAQEEIDDVKGYYRETYKSSSTTNEEETVKDDPQVNYEQLAARYSEESTSVKIEDDVKPYVISPEELGDIEEYDTTTLYYYADGILVDLEDNIIENADEVVGEDFADHFGEYEDDSVCVRNDSYKTDYEILKDPQRYEDAHKLVRPEETGD